MKRKVFAVLLAIMMVFAMLPLNMGKVNAEADIDITKPVIDVDSITRTMPEGKDKVTVGDSVTLSLKASDDRGMSEVQFYIKSPVTGDVISEYAVYEGDDEETKNGLWTATFNVDDDTENGVWRVVTIAARDTTGNEDVYYDSEIYYWMDPRMDLSFLSYEVYGTSSDPDITKPVIDTDSITLTLPEGKEKVSVGDSISLSLEASDDRGMNDVKFYIKSPVTGDEISAYAVYEGDDEETKNGLWTATFDIDDDTENGVWRVATIAARDTSGNEDVYYDSEIYYWYEPHTMDLSFLSYEVYGTSSDPDIIKPVIDVDSLTLTLPEGKNKVSVGDSISLSLEATDDIGMNDVKFYIKSPVTGDEISEYAVYEGDDEETKNGLWTATVEVTDTTENGIWRVVTIAARDTSGNEDVYYDSEIYYWMRPRMDLSFLSYEVTSPECPTDLSDDGYSMMLDGEGATKTFGGNYYVKSLTETVTPEVKVRYDDESGSWNTLSPRKYTLKFEKKTGDDTWEEYTGTTFGVDEDGTATYRVGATGKESLHYTGSIDPVEFNVIKMHKVTFDSRGGSTIDPQYVKPGGKATEPDDPTREGWEFDGDWYSDEELTTVYNFNTPVTEDITLRAAWYTTMSLGVYNDSNPENYDCGTVDVKTSKASCVYTDLETANFTVPEGDVEFTAKPDEGYSFVGWYKGIVGESGFVEGPTDELLSEDTVYTFAAEPLPICAVFECTEHQWVDKIQKATPTADGRIYQVCSVCGTDETVAPLLKVSRISLDKTEFTYTGEAIEPKVTVANDCEELAPENYDVTYSKNINAGTATAKITLKGDYYEGSKSLNFKINKAEQTITAKSITLKKGTTADIDARASAGGILSYKVKSGDAVKVDEDGIVTGLKKGKAVITITAGELPNYNSATKDINVTVTEAVYTVTFKANGHGKDPEPQKVVEGKKAVKPADPEAKGYILLGWYTDKACTKEYNFNSKVTKNLTLYAKWTVVVDMYRMYNPNSGEHFYTASTAERNDLRSAGWAYEGIAWRAPKESKTPVYRVYNANAGDHHYTISKAERDTLVAAGWKDEGIGWYSDDAKTVPIYRVYNPNATTGSHHFTMSKNEVNELVKAGWKDEGTAWFGTD